MREMCIGKDSSVREQWKSKKLQKRIRNKTNAEISYCQTTLQQFGRLMKGRFLVKGNKDKSIPKKSSDGEENVDC